MRSAFAWATGLVLLLALAGAVEANSATNEIPIVGRPAEPPFSEASGRFEVSARAVPTAVAIEAPLTLTITVRAVGPWHHPPRPIDLKQVPTFNADFYIEDVADRPPLAAGAAPQSWELVYRLKPRRGDVTEVPSFPFAFYNPEIRPADKGFQVIYTDPIPLRVGGPPVTMARPVRGFEGAFEVAGGPAVLARQTVWQAPGTGELALYLLAPPLLSAGWYLAWRRLWPDAARQALHRRSRAARHALAALRSATALAPRPRAERVAEVVADYLRQRFDLPAGEPTPPEAAARLAQHGCHAELTERAERFFRACDEARFLPQAAPTNLVEAAEELILAVEATWSPLPS
jgi:hypothetical protein